MKMKPKQIRIFLIILFILTSLGDVISTLWDKRLLIFEQNFLWTEYKSLLMMSLIKIGVTCLICSMYWLSLKKTHFWQYFWSLMMVLVILTQAYATYNNITIINQLKDVPTEKLAEYTLSNEAQETHLKLLAYMLYVPIFISLLSFKIWQWSFQNRKNKVPQPQQLPIKK